MNIERQQKIDKAIASFRFKFTTEIISSCKTTEEAIYATTCLTHDFTQMLYKAIHRNVPLQEAKAAFKIALDSVLLDYGMSIAIHEFNA